MNFWGLRPKLYGLHLDRCSLSECRGANLMQMHGSVRRQSVSTAVPPDRAPAPEGAAARPVFRTRPYTGSSAPGLRSLRENLSAHVGGTAAMLAVSEAQALPLSGSRDLRIRR
jgi:hypothetical protein